MGRVISCRPMAQHCTPLQAGAPWPRLVPVVLILTLSLMLSMALPLAARAAPLQVVASFSIIADLAQQVGGDRIAVTALIGPESEAHDHAPRPADAVALARADLVLVNGLGLEGFVDRLLVASGTAAPVVTLGAAITPLHGADGVTPDPHAWQAPQNARAYVEMIAHSLCGVDPGGCATYQDNARAYDAQLQALDDAIRTSLAPIPESRRIVAVPHDAFAYFGAAYGVRFLAPQGTAPEAEASAAGLAALLREMRSADVQAVLAEAGTNPALMEQIARESGLVLGGELFSDALSRPEGPAPTYLQMMQHNAATIAAALGAGG